MRQSLKGTDFLSLPRGIVPGNTKLFVRAISHISFLSLPWGIVPGITKLFVRAISHISLGLFIFKGHNVFITVLYVFYNSNFKIQMAGILQKTGGMSDPVQAQKLRVQSYTLYYLC